ncbi:hypothetical protein BLA29_007786 [Euroglyphus maynei]|uniref:Uncharacterized protein n=1 Tax=Euroglyphus maynei TaxID=6958 RepID=A0A1Y3AN57_EURMA|nr:hypothetical protein BLA29_007786 [Euroglyphus maynei]
MDDENLPIICTDYCTNTGIIIFITTLIVTIVHLTLGASVYLYITKLKQTKKFIHHHHHNRGVNRKNLMFIPPPAATTTE